MQIKLPYPPSLNTYYRNWRGRTVISAQGLVFRNLVAVATEGMPKTNERIRLTLLVCPPDRRRRDLDNVCKATLDALQHAGLYDDDSQIDELRIVRGDKVDGGLLFVNLEEIK